MSFLPLTSLLSLDAAPGSSGPPLINQAAEPEAVRYGSTAAKQAYQEGLDFEQMLVNELAQELTCTVSSSETDLSSSDDGSGDDSNDGATGLLGSDASSAGYESMIPDALTSSIMSAGGTGLALALARSIDPSAFADEGGSTSDAGRASAANATSQAVASGGAK